MAESAVRRPAQMLALARLISISGSMAASIAITFTLWDRTKSPAWVAAGALATSLVAGLLTPYAGSLGDRFDRRELMVLSDLAAAVFFILLGIAVAMTAHPGVLVVLATAAAVCETPFVPASRAAMPNLVPDELLGWANGLLGRVTGLSFAVGPLVGGALAALIGVAAVFVVNAVTFAASALLVWRIRGVFQRGDVQGRASGGVREGFASVSREPILRAVIFSGFVAFAGVGFVIVANPARADEIGTGSFGLGAIWAGWGVGTILGAFLAGRYLRPGNEVRLAVLGFSLQTVALLAAAPLTSIVPMVAALSVGGIGGGLADPARQTLVQRRSPDAVRGRVFAVLEAVGWSSFAVSLIAAGALVDQVGVDGAFLIGGVLFAVGTVLMAVLARDRGDVPTVAAPGTR